MTTTVSLGEICEFLGGGTPSRKVHQYWNGGIPWATVKDFGTDRISHTAEFISQEGLDNSASKIVPSGTVLLVTRVGLGKVAMAGVDLAINQDIKAIVPSNNILPEFLLWSLKHIGPEIERKGVGATVKGVTLHDVKELKVPLPPLHEQRRIVGILNRASHIERLRARATDRLQQFIPALFLKMFGDPAGNPMDWNRVPFGNVVTDTTRKVTKVQKRDYASTGKIPIVDQGAELIAGYANDKSGYYDRELPIIIFGDHTRRFKLIRFPFFLGADGAKVLLPNCNDLDPVFLYGQFECLELENAGYSRHFKFLKSKELILPPIEQQKRFRTLLEGATEISDSMGEATNTAAALSASLMDRLLDR